MKFFLLSLLVTVVSACSSNPSRNARVVANEQEDLILSTDGDVRPIVIQKLSFLAKKSNCIVGEQKKIGFTCSVDLSSLGLDPDAKIIRTYALGSHIKEGFVIQSNTAQSLQFPYKTFVEITVSGAGKPEVRLPTEKLNSVIENGIEIQMVYQGPEIKF